MIDLFINLLALCGIFVLLTGALFWFHVLKPNRPPMDESNRFAHFILVWDALKSPEDFVGLKRDGKEAFSYLTKDIGDQLEG